MRLKNRRWDPPGGWVYTTDQGVVIREKLFDLLLYSAIQHFKANDRFGTLEGRNDKGLTVYTRESLQAAIEQQICENSPPGTCLEDERPPQERFDMHKVVAVARALIQHYSNSVITPELADSRAATCLNCKLNNSAFRGCWTCNSARSLVSRTVKRKTSLDKHLYICNVCGCLLAVKVWLTPEGLRQTNTVAKEKYPDYCWMRSVLDGKA
jgi:hypothetical protein